MKNIRSDFPQGNETRFTIFVGGDRNTTRKTWSLFKISGKLDSNSSADSPVLHFKIVKNCSCDDISKC